MKTYEVQFERTFNSSITVEAEDPDDASTKAWEQFMKSDLSDVENAQDSGWEEVYSREVEDYDAE